MNCCESCDVEGLKLLILICKLQKLHSHDCHADHNATLFLLIRLREFFEIKQIRSKSFAAITNNYEQLNVTLTRLDQ